MSDAVDNAEVMLYAVSEKYKESGNCRLEANYAHQQDVEMIPLMVQEDYKAKGWLGLFLGTRMWYPFYGCEDDDDAAFEERVDSVAREIGERGKAISASVSVWKRLMATTTLTPWLVTLRMCANRLAAPASTSGRFSSVYSFDNAAPATTLGAFIECSLSARTVQTRTAQLGRSPE